MTQKLLKGLDSVNRIYAAALAVFVLVSLCSTAARAQDDNSLRSAIETVNKHFTSALNQGDVADAVSVYADDAQILAATVLPGLTKQVE